jgi:hypothetical protein
MRDSLRVLAISGALALAAALSPAIAQTAGPAPIDNSSPAADPAQTAGPAQPDSAAQPASAQTTTPVPDEDLKKALSEIRSSWRDFEKCSGRVCNDYFDSFGVGITFNDGTLAPFAHVQRLKTSRHDCIMNARDALDRGDRSMAVQWVMASQMREPLERNWLGDHPDAVLAALRHAVF